MAGRPRQPVDLLIAKGKSHMGQKEIEERREQEVKVPFDQIETPEYLTGASKKEFEKYAYMLKEIGIFTELDVECLVRYVMSQALYMQYTNKLLKLVKNGTVQELKGIQSLQDRAFRQAQSAASSLGLTISSRCKLTVPKVASDEDLEL